VRRCPPRAASAQGTIDYRQVWRHVPALDVGDDRHTPGRPWRRAQPVSGVNVSLSGASVRPTRTALAPVKNASKAHAVKVAADGEGVVRGCLEMHDQSLGGVVGREAGHIAVRGTGNTATVSMQRRRGIRGRGQSRPRTQDAHDAAPPHHLTETSHPRDHRGAAGAENRTGISPSSPLSRSDRLAIFRSPVTGQSLILWPHRVHARHLHVIAPGC
jgi:hypothetical protein